MRKAFVLPAIVILSSLFAAAHAQVPTLIYSFENGDSPNSLDGFAENQGGTVFQSTMGATNGSNSLGYTMLASDTFTGIITQSLAPALLSPETEEINFDLTIPSTGNYTGTFADIGIAEFGVNDVQGYTTNTPVFTAQGQERAYQNIDLVPGTYNISIPLVTDTNPVTGAGPVTMSSCFGNDTDSQLTMTDFEFYISKSSDQPLTVYIDNVKAEPLLGDTNDDFSVDSKDLATIVANLGQHVTGGYADGDFNGDGIVNGDDFALYQLGVAQYNFLNFQPLPEPALAFAVMAFMVAFRRQRKVAPI